MIAYVCTEQGELLVRRQPQRPFDKFHLVQRSSLAPWSKTLLTCAILWMREGLPISE